MEWDPVDDIAAGYRDVFGNWHATSDIARSRLAEAMGGRRTGPPMWFVASGETPPLWSPCRVLLEDGSAVGPFDALPATLPIGYHRLVPVDGGPVTRLFVHPPRCPVPPRAAGMAVQTYALWDEHAWGIGDLGTLQRLARRLVDVGAPALLVSPLHRGSPGFPQQDSPYSPSTRRAWSPLLLAVDDPPPDHLRMRPDRLIDRDTAWRAKRDWWWQRFVGSEDERLLPAPTGLALFDARAELGPDVDDGRLLQVARFHDWLQDRVAEQLAAVRQTGAVLIGDLAVGFDPQGADATEFDALIARDVEVGAPPDEFNPGGQAWGLAAFVPAALRAHGYEPFIDTVRAAFRGVGGLRIDHVMGLYRQFWVTTTEQATTDPTTGSAGSDSAGGDRGGYVRFPVDDLMAIIAIEATRAGAFVIGEDLGTVPDEVHVAMRRWGVFGTRVAIFDDAPMSALPVDCLATLTTHDLPTVRQVLELADDDQRRRRLLASVDAAATKSLDHVVDRIHRVLLHSPARLRLLTADDLAGAVEQPNVPGTVGPPNWCRPLPRPVPDIPLDVFRGDQV